MYLNAKLFNSVHQTHGLHVFGFWVNELSYRTIMLQFLLQKNFLKKYNTKILFILQDFINDKIDYLMLKHTNKYSIFFFITFYKILCIFSFDQGIDFDLSTYLQT